MTWYIGRYMASSAATLLFGWAATAGATQETATPGAVLEEVVVTAQRRSEDLQKTPIAVTALSTEALEERNITSTQELMQAVPSLQVSTQTAGNGSGSATFFLRGLGQQRAGNGSQPAVGVYVDDFYYPSLNGTVFNILDIQQVEVLRGPQGTLFGRNTIGGAIRYTTKKPEQTFGGAASATVGSFSRQDFTAVVNAPLGDQASARVTLGSLKDDGFVKRLFTSGHSGGSTTKLARGQLRLQPTAAVTIDLSGQYSESDLDGYAYRLTGPFNGGIVSTVWNTVPAGPIAAARAALGPYDSRYASSCDFCQPGTKSALNPEEYSNTVSKDAQAVIAWDINDALTLKSLTGYTQVSNESYSDLDGTPLPILGFFGTSFVKASSQELQLNGRAFNDSIKWVGGLYYNNEKQRVDGLNGQGALALNAVRPPTASDRDTVNEAGFFDLTWQAREQLAVLGGYRYSTEDKKVVRRPTAGSPTLAQKRFNSSTGRVGIQYQWTPTLMSYLTVSQGFRSGGFNILGVATPATATQPSTFFEPFDPETSTTYEIGARTTLLDNRLRLNPTVFYNKWDNIQVQRFDIDIPTATQIIHLENAGKAHTYGAEIELDAAVSSAFHVFGNLATLKAKYDSIGTANGITLDSKFQRAPALSYGAGASYTFSLDSAGSLIAMANYSWQDEQASTPTDSSNPPLSRRDALVLPSYNVTNIRVEYRDAHNHWAVAAFATNLFDKLYYIGGVDYPETSPHYDIGRPREIGVTARYKF